MNVVMNKKGNESFDEVLSKGLNALSPEEFEEMAEHSGALILDVRNNNDFAKGFVPQSINIGLDGDFAPWVGALIVDVKQPILLITDENNEEETVTRLSRVGFDNVLGFLKGNFEAWKNSGKEIDKVHRISAQQFENEIENREVKIIDIRKESEYEAEHVDEAYNKPLAYINEWINDIEPTEHFYLHCAGGYRSMMAASILLARGYRNFTEIEGGFNAIAQTDIPKSDFVCQSKVLK
jgi:rhodanese-related sulfurtransferase